MMRVLVADDDEGVLMALRLLLRREQIDLTEARSPHEVLVRLRGEVFDVILLDLNYERDTTSGAEGFALLDELRKAYPNVPVVVMTGWASIEGAVRAMRHGAVDYVPKPWDNARLIGLLRHLSAPERGAPALAARTVWSAAMKRVVTTVEQVAFADVPILITGEHGTGKEVIARLIHEKSARRGAFVAINAGALPDAMFESELFGHVRGAFTDAKAARVGAFARARDGTLFLDEIANMPLAQQAKLLRVLQERAYQPLGAATPVMSNARIVSATNVDLEALGAGGLLRPDLLYRLNAIHVGLSPLRERSEEIAPLADLFVRRAAERYGLALPSLDGEVLDLLRNHDWPGNVRELEHAMQRAVLLSAKTGCIRAEDVGLGDMTGRAPNSAPEQRDGKRAAPAGHLDSRTDAPTRTPETLRDTERAAVMRALERFPDNRLAAAKSLGLSRSAFYRRLAHLGIRPPR